MSLSHLESSVTVKPTVRYLIPVVAWVEVVLNVIVPSELLVISRAACITLG
ncbi:hypothetical protein D3C71_2152780 [compost metagenome]